MCLLALYTVKSGKGVCFSPITRATPGVQGQIIFVAIRDIQAGEELTHDWAMTDDDTSERECNCGSPQCRKIITGQDDWRRKDLQEKYGEYMSWYLQEKIKRECGK